MLIDIHTHARLVPSIGRPANRTRPMAEDLIEMLDAHGIDKAVVLSAVSPECRHFMDTPEDVMGVHRKFPDRVIAFCSVDPRMVANRPEADFGPLLEQYKEAGFKGIGEYIPNIPFDDSLNMNLFKHVEASGLPLTFHIGPTLGGCYGCYDELGLPRLENALKAFPQLKFFGHSQPFWAEIGTGLTEETRRGYPTGPVQPGRLVELFRKYPNLYGDLSAGSGFNAISRDPEFGYAFMEEFQDRLFFGTDIAHLGQELPIVDYFRKLKEEKLISDEAHEKICWRNAVRVLGL